jgi:hypothetical protein
MHEIILWAQVQNRVYCRSREGVLHVKIVTWTAVKKEAVRPYAALVPMYHSSRHRYPDNWHLLVAVLLFNDPISFSMIPC